MKTNTIKTFTVELTHDEANQLRNCLSALPTWIDSSVEWATVDQCGRLDQLRNALANELDRL